MPAVRQRPAALRRLAAAARGVVALAVLLLWLGPVPSAQAESADAARRAAAAAAADLAALAPKVQAALQAYQQSLNDLAVGVQRRVSGEQAADVAALAAAAAQAQQDARVRALYMSGGSLGLMASVLGSGSPTDVADRMVSVRRVLQVGAAAEAAAAAHSGRLHQAVGSLDAAVVQQVTTVADVEARYAQLQAVLDQAGARLATLSARARALTQAEAAAAQLRALAQAAAQAGAGLVSRATPMAIPPDYRRLYVAAAATCPGLSWTVLAAIGQVESGHGRNVGPSSAGAMGPMQFMPSTFEHYAVDGDHDGVTDILDPADAIFTAAHYLCANKAGTGPAGLRNAIYRYNHAEWYVELVLRLASLIH